MRLFISFFFLVLFMACNSSDKETPTIEKPTAETNASAANTNGTLLPSVSKEFMKMLWDSTSYLDYTFYTLPMSMSFDSKASIQNVLSHLEGVPVSIASSCKPTGRAFFQKDGEDLGVAEFYLHKDCRCFVFMKDGKPAYSNRISDKGIKFYQNSLSQAVKQTQQGQ